MANNSTHYKQLQRVLVKFIADKLIMGCGKKSGYIKKYILVFEVDIKDSSCSVEYLGEALLEPEYWTRPKR